MAAIPVAGWIAGNRQSPCRRSVHGRYDRADRGGKPQSGKKSGFHQSSSGGPSAACEARSDDAIMKPSDGSDRERPSSTAWGSTGRSESGIPDPGRELRAKSLRLRRSSIRREQTSVAASWRRRGECSKAFRSDPCPSRCRRSARSRRIRPAHRSPNSGFDPDNYSRNGP